MKKEPSPAQLAARKKFGEQAKARAAAKRAEKELNQVADETPTAPEIDDFDVTDFKETPSNEELQRQLLETQKTLELLLKGAQLNQPQPTTLGSSGKVLGVVEKYLIDPNNYPDPTKRLAQEPRLNSIAFNYNYELEYAIDVSSYETKSGVNMKEPKFMVQLNRIRLNDQGEQTNKRYIARKLVFHEDPQAAIVIARDNGIEVDQSDEKAFLDEMRYLRVRDWLFDIFWPRPVNEASQISEESIGGQIVQVFTKSSEDSSSIDFDSLQDKMKV